MAVDVGAGPAVHIDLAEPNNEKNSIVYGRRSNGKITVRIYRGDLMVEYEKSSEMPAGGISIGGDKVMETEAADMAQKFFNCPKPRVKPGGLGLD